MAVSPQTDIRTDGLEQQSCRVQGEQRDVEEEKECLDNDNWLRSMVKTGEHDIYGPCAHADGELWIVSIK